MTAELTRGLAHRIIHTLGETGTPPDRGVSWLNVGNDLYLKVLRDEYLDLLLREGGSTFKLVQAYYGGGKTHFLLCLREDAWRAGYVTSYVGLSPGESPFHEPLMVYRAVIRQLRAPPLDDEPIAPTTGLPDLLRDLIEVRRDEHGVTAVRTWLLRTVRQLPVESPSLRNAISAYGIACLDDDLAAQDVLSAWLRGEEIPATQHRDHGVFESITKANAFTMLRGVCQALRGLGFPGTALLFDELDRNLSVGASTKNRTRLTDNLRELVDLCGRGALPGVLLTYAVPPEFLRQVVPEYPALQQRLASPVELSARSPQAMLIDLEKLELSPAELLRGIGTRILEVFHVARSHAFNPAIQKENLESLADEAAQSSFEVSHRRIFVKAWVGLLNAQIADGERVLTFQEISQLISGRAQELLQLPDERGGGWGDKDDGYED